MIFPIYDIYSVYTNISVADAVAIFNALEG